LCFDVSLNSVVIRSISSLPEKWKNIHVLINNAGNAHGMDFFRMEILMIGIK
jgi:NADP-dependent 3-hydroxy acid dehydrogenase YdfG